MRRDYEEGRGTQTEIAARYGLTKTCLAMRKVRHGWISARDAERWEKRETEIDTLIDQLTQRLKQHAETGAELAAEAKAQAVAGGTKGLAARRRASAEAARELSITLAMTTTVQRLAERRREDTARFAVRTRENPLDRPDYLAVERAILARLAAAGLGTDLGDADAGREGAACGILGVAPDAGADAA